MHQLFEVDGIEDFDAVAFLQKGVADFQNRGALGEDFVKIFRGNIFRIFASKLAVLTSSSIKRFILAFRKPFRWGISFSKRVKFFNFGVAMVKLRKLIGSLIYQI